MWSIFIIPVYIEHWKLYRKIASIKLLLFYWTYTTVANKIIAKNRFWKKKRKKLLFLYGHQRKIRSGKISPRFFLIRYDEDPRYPTAINILSSHAFCFYRFRETKFSFLKNDSKLANYPIIHRKYAAKHTRMK